MKTTRAAHWSDLLDSLGSSCESAMKWACTQPDPLTAWEACPDASWLLRLIDDLLPITEDLHRSLVRIACACTRPSLRYVLAGEKWPRRAIEAAEAWCLAPGAAAARAATAASARAVAAACAVATYAPTAAAAAAASEAAAACTSAADAAMRVDHAVNFAVDAIGYYAARDATDVAYAIAARAAALRKMASIVRAHVPAPLDALAAYGRAIAYVGAMQGGQ